MGIDCGWDLRERAPNGDLQPNPKKFPLGIKHVADYVKSLGAGYEHPPLLCSHIFAAAVRGCVLTARRVVNCRLSLCQAAQTRNYSEHDTGDCCGGPGMKGFEDQDAKFYKDVRPSRRHPPICVVAKHNRQVKRCVE